MSRIDWVPSINHFYQSLGFPPYRWSVFDDTPPFVPVKKPLAELKVALISSAGVSVEGQEPFAPWAVNGLGIREIPINTPFENLRLNHNYYDHRDALKDFNCVLPVQRLAELADEGLIGGLTPSAVSLGMGRLYKRTALQTETVPRIMDVFKSQGADAALLVAA